MFACLGDRKTLGPRLGLLRPKLKQPHTWQMASLFVLFSALLGVCAAYAPAQVAPRLVSSNVRAGALLMQETEEKTEAATEAAAPPAPPAVEYSESLPFLVKRPQLKGYVGDVGFDPLGFSEILPMVRSSSAQQHAGV